MSAKTTKPSSKKTSSRKTKKSDEHVMKKPRIFKITVNIGVGEAGEKLSKAQQVLEDITKQKSIQTLSKTTNKDWGLRKGMPLGCKVSLRGNKAHEFLTQAFKTRENRIADYAFDDQGNFSFGIPDHTLFVNQRYDPTIGIFGMDISVTMEKPGFRVKRRRFDRRTVPKRHQVESHETMDFVKNTFAVEVVK